MRMRINTTPGCERPASCRNRRTNALCLRCEGRLAGVAEQPNETPSHTYVVRIDLTPLRRRRLGEMAKEAAVSADELASRLLSDLIDEDAAAHAGATA